MDILKGPALVLYGQTPPGGVVNLVSKRPSADTTNQVFVEGGNDERVRGGFDISGKFDRDGKVLYRVVGIGGRSDGPGAAPNAATFSIAPAVTFHISDATQLTVLAKYRDDPEGERSGALPYIGMVAPLPDGRRFSRDLFVGDHDFDTFQRRDRQVGYEFSYRFDKHIQFRQHLRYQQVEGDY